MVEFSQAPPTQDILPPEGIHNPGILRRLANFAERPLGRFTVAMVATLALAAGDQGEGSASRFDSSMSMTFESGGASAALHFADWEEERGAGAFTQASGPSIEQNQALEALTSTNNPLTDKLGLTPPKIENPNLFSDWVAGQAQKPELLASIGLTPDSSPTPRQLIDLSAAIVITSIDYNYKDGENSNYGLPTDQNLENGNALQCEGYASATVAVFNELKRTYPEALKNTYMVTQGGIAEGHVWDLVVQVEGPSEASISFIDPAGDDPSYLEGSEIDLGFVELIEGLFTKGLIDHDTFSALADQYEQMKELSPQELHELDMDAAYTELPADTLTNVG